jgi:hypothetical protein
MKKYIVILALAVVTAFMLGATATTVSTPEAPNTSNSVQQVVGGQNTFRTYVFADTFNGATTCTTAWMQYGYDFSATTETGNKNVMMTGSNTFAVFVSTSLMGAGDSAYIPTIKYEIALNAAGNPPYYTTSDSSCYVIGLSDSPSTGASNVVYPMYAPGGVAFRLFITSVGTDTFPATITVMGAKN